jgi:hypothetical protein
MVFHEVRKNALLISIPQRQLMPIPAYDTYVYKLPMLHAWYLYHAPMQLCNAYISFRFDATYHRDRPIVPDRLDAGAALPTVSRLEGTTTQGVTVIASPLVSLGPYSSLNVHDVPFLPLVHKWKYYITHRL